MEKQKRELPVLLPSRGIVKYITRGLYSLSNFVKASILSIVILLVIFLLLSEMEQAYTMLIRMLEFSKPSLFLCFFILNILAIGVSHYPIYNYYAGNLNGSKKYVRWREHSPYRLLLFRHIKLYTFEPIIDPGYVKDIYANVLRHYLGLTLYLIWFHFIFSTFESNLRFSIDRFEWIQFVSYFLIAVPYVTYVVLKRRIHRDHSTRTQRKKIYLQIGYSFFVSTLATLFCLGFILFSSSLFSLGGMFMLLLTTYLMMFNFVFFRLVRPRLRHVLMQIVKAEKRCASIFLRFIRPISLSVNYLMLFQISFLISIVAIAYFNLATINNWSLPNGIAIVLVYLYFYFFIIVALGKYFFVKYSIAQKEREKQSGIRILDQRSFKFTISALIVATILFTLGFFTESRLNELKIHKVENRDVSNLSEFEQRLAQMPDTLFFVSSYGGGLKANTWTMLVLNELQKSSNGRFIDQCVTFSGASGGSLGLALYGDLAGNYGHDFDKIRDVINKIRKDNYASSDVSLLFGWDVFRIFFPANYYNDSKDRSYYGMVKYQNHVHESYGRGDLDTTLFRTYWKQLQSRGNQLPILVMNTASTTGRRGIFCSSEIPDFDRVFPYAIDLGSPTCEDGSKGSLSFYQALSTTNRFPVLSPVAKIKGKGYFIDAGAIDNSGILGAWDVYLHFSKKGKLSGKTIVFLNIDNSKSGYVEHIFANFLNGNFNSVSIEENEKSALIANLQTGMSLNKIPGYLNDFMENMQTDDSSIVYQRIFLPHKVTIEDIEDLIGGKIKHEIFLSKLTSYLKEHNNEILLATEQQNRGFWEEWNSYEPVLSRQLSESNNNYFDAMLNAHLSGILKVKNILTE